MELNNLKTESSKLRLTESEKTAMKVRVFGMPSPANVAPKQSPYFIFTYQFMQARMLAPLAVFLVVFAGGSTAAAAQGALPGDVLYPIKISVNEAVEVALATTPVEKAEVSVKQAVRRVEEAEVLAARGELTVETGEKLAANFEVHAENATELAGKVEAEDPAAARNLRTKLGSSLEAHGAILATLTVGGARANQEGAGAVAAKVLARADSAPAIANTMTMRSSKAAPAPAFDSAEPQATTMAMSLSITSDTSTSSEATGTVSLEGDMLERASINNPEQKAEAAQLSVRAQAQIDRARERFEDTKAKLVGSAATQVSGEFAAIDSLMEQGSSTQATADFDLAAAKYTEALKRATKIYVLLKAQANFSQNIITPILEKSLEGESSYEIRTLPADR